MSVLDETRCGNCMSYQPRPGLDTGKCRRNPPERLDPEHSAYPTVHVDNWCGEWNAATPQQMKQRAELAAPAVPPTPQNLTARWAYPSEASGQPMPGMVRVNVPKREEKANTEPATTKEGSPFRNNAVAKPA